MTQRVSLDAQGKLQGATSSITAIGQLVGPILFTQIFAATLSWGVAYSGLAYLLSSALLLVAAFGVTLTLRRTAT